MRLSILAITTLLAFGLIACGDDDDADPTTPASPGAGESATPDASDDPTPTATDEPADDPTLAPASVDTCVISITGEAEVEYTDAAGPESAASDYWLSEEDIRGILRAFYESREGLAGDELEARIDERIAEETAVVSILVINCIGPGSASVSVFSIGDATYDEIPFGPGDYSFASGAGGEGEFIALVNAGQTGYGTVAGGELTISAWDDTHIAGQFAFEASRQDDPGGEPALDVAGSFDLPCGQQSACAGIQ